jgi:hypothetical protein
MGPAGRSGHGVAYDTARSRAVLFGGSDGASELADTSIRFFIQVLPA